MATQYTAGLSAGQVLTAATMNSIGAAWEAWTPTLTASTTNPTLGTGSSRVGRYGQVNKIVTGYGKITFGTSGTAAGNGFYSVTVPITAQASAPTVPIGTVYLGDGGVNVRVGVLVLGSTTTATIRYDAGALVTQAAPWAWGANALILYNFTYEAA